MEQICVPAGFAHPERQHGRASAEVLGARAAGVARRGHGTGASRRLGVDIVRRAAVAAGGGLVVASSPSGGMLAVVTLGVAKG